MPELAPRWQSPPPIYETSVSPMTTLRPYLTLPHLLSLTWLAYPILSLLFVALRLQLSLNSAENAVADAKEKLLNSCSAAEQAATGAASLPRFIAIGTNKQIVDAVNGTMNGAREALVLSLTVMEAIINFIIDIYRSTFLCFLELVVRGGLAILIGAVQEIQQFIQGTLGGIRTSIQNDVVNVNSAITSAINGVNKILPPGAKISVPQFNIPSLDSLNNVTLPTDFEDALIKLNASIPSLSDLRHAIEAFVDTPFELVKKDINDTFIGFSFNQSTLPVPQLNTLSFCNNLDTGVVDDLGIELIKVARIGTIILILLALLLVASHCVLEWYKWRCLHRSLENTRLAWASDPTIYHVTVVSSTPSFHMTDDNLLILHATSSHPLLSRIANQISSLFNLTPSQHIHLRWFFHYVFHPPALACFLIGFFGLMSIELQLLALSPVQAKFSTRVASSVADFSSTIADSMNASMQNESSFYANSINGQVSTIQTGINDGLFGWVNGTTSTLNQTLVTFYTDIQNAVETVFGGTILDQVAQEFVRCIIGTKVQSLENALTFLHDNLHVDLPVVSQDVLTLSPDQVNDAIEPISLAAVGSGGPGDNGGIVGSLVNSYASSLRKERVMFCIFLGLWSMVVFMAFCIIFWHSYGKKWVNNHKRMKWRREQREGNSSITPWSRGNTFTDPAPRQLTNEREKELPSFPPLMSPPEKIGFFAALRKSASDTERSRRGSQHVRSYSYRSPSLNGRKSNKLMAIGRRAVGHEVLVPDEAAERQLNRSHDERGEIFEVEVREERGTAWWNRLWKRRASDESFGTDEDQIQPQPRTEQRRIPFPNPNLIIETNILLPKSQRDRYPLIVQDEPLVHERPVEQQPTSAGSMSPEVTRQTPWMRPLPTNTLPLRPKLRPTANLPQSVDGTYGHFSLGVAADSIPVRHPPVAGVPIHHGFVRPIPVGTPSSPSPPSSPVAAQTMFSPPTGAIQAVHSGPTPDTPSNNPFATCFDDEHHAPSSPPPTKHLSVTNPFADAGTPRAV